MSTGNEKRQRKRATRVRRQSPAPARRESTFARDTESTEHAAREHYRREKARRAERVRPPEHPLEQARHFAGAALNVRTCHGTGPPARVLRRAMRQ
jgi:hypothetical protein